MTSEKQRGGLEWALQEIGELTGAVEDPDVIAEIKEVLQRHDAAILEPEQARTREAKGSFHAMKEENARAWVKITKLETLLRQAETNASENRKLYRETDKARVEAEEGLNKTMDGLNNSIDMFDKERIRAEKAEAERDEEVKRHNATFGATERHEAQIAELRAEHESQVAELRAQIAEAQR